MKRTYPDIDTRTVETYPLHTRKNNVSVHDFAKPQLHPASSLTFLNSLPDLYAGNDFKRTVEAIVHAHQRDQLVIFAFGGHVVKCGVSPYIISLIREGIITGIASTGSGSIHDFEIALIGETSENVSETITDGRFGMSEETGRLMNEAINEGAQSQCGMGESLGRKLLEIKPPFLDYSILAGAVSHEIPVTIHVAVGTDIIHQHPMADGSAIGATTFKDFRTLISEVAGLGDGGVFINFGSAVIIPEVFLKALSVARNLGYPVTHFTTANFDMIQQYRPRQNIVKRPVHPHGSGYSITGHHELMIPLLYRSIQEALS